jgi:hypothetical protein
VGTDALLHHQLFDLWLHKNGDPMGPRCLMIRSQGGYSAGTTLELPRRSLTQRAIWLPKT